MDKGKPLRWLDEFFGLPLRLVAREQLDFLASAAGQKPDWQTMLVVVTVAGVLTAQNYCLIGGGFGLFTKLPQLVLSERLAQLWSEVAFDRQNWQFLRHVDWALGTAASYVLLPVLLIKCVFRQRLPDYGLKLRGITADWWVYLLMYFCLLPFLLAVSHLPSFQQVYPFYRLGENESWWPRFMIFEGCYALQFVSLEFFFRGFLLHGTRRRFGPYAIFVMSVPYCMIHFNKPPLEAYASIGTGVILGFMSLKTRSIWLGAALHVAVAWTMDAAALAQR